MTTSKQRNCEKKQEDFSEEHAKIGSFFPVSIDVTENLKDFPLFHWKGEFLRPAALLKRDSGTGIFLYIWQIF